MKLFFSTLLITTLASFTLLADSNPWSTNKSGDKVSIILVEPGQKLTVEPHFIPFIDNALDIKVSGVTVYTVNIQGSNSYNQNFLMNAKDILEKSYNASLAQCGDSPIIVLGELMKWNSHLLSDDDILVVYPLSLRTVCQ